MFGVQETLPILQGRLADPDGFRRWEALNALGRIIAGSSVPLVSELTRSDDEQTRREATLVLGKLQPHAGAQEALFGLLDHADPGVRWRAAMALRRGALGDAARQALAARLAIETDKEVRRHIERTLRRRR